MSKSEQILSLEPKHELHFKGPYSDVVTSYLKLSNPSDRRVCFKVKTTAPKRYCVRPNNGIIEPKAAASIAVMLQPFDVEQSDKSKHKFMVQTMYAPEGDFNQETLWKEAAADAIMDSKLKCVFDVPLGQASSVSMTESNDPSTLSSHTASSPRESSFLNTAGDETQVKRYQEENRRLREEASQLRQDLMKSREEGLRQRKTAASSSESSFAAQQAAAIAAEPELGSLLMNPQILAVLVVIFAMGLFVGKILF